MLFVSLTKQHLNFASWGPGVHFWQQCPAQSRSRARQLLREHRCGTGTHMEQSCSELMRAKNTLLNLLSHPSHTFLLVIKSFRMNPARPASPVTLSITFSLSSPLLFHLPSLPPPPPLPLIPPPSRSPTSQAEPSTGDNTLYLQTPNECFITLLLRVINDK